MTKIENNVQIIAAFMLLRVRRPTGISVEVLMLWGHKARLWLPSITLHANWLGDGRISCAGIAIGGTRTGRGGSNPWRIERRFDPAGQTRVPTNQKLVGKSRGNLVFAGEPP